MPADFEVKPLRQTEGSLIMAKKTLMRVEVEKAHSKKVSQLESKEHHETPNANSLPW